MGTNYNLIKTCSHCKHQESRHIGKSSSGWVFALHVYPDEGIQDLADWALLWSGPNVEIRDEYNQVVSPEEMLQGIIERGSDEPPRPGFDYSSNYAEPGPNNLVRSKVDGSRCVGHGSGTWDLFVGDFSYIWL